MSEYTPPPGYNGGFAPLSSWGGNTAATNPAIADVYNRGWTTTGTSFNVPVLGPYQAPSFASYLGEGPAQAMGYADSNAQLQDSLGMSSRYATGWPWGNKAGRYSFANGATQPPGGLLGGGSGQGTPGAGTPPSAPPGGSAPGLPGVQPYNPPGDWTATGGPPNQNGVYPAAGPRPQGFGPSQAPAAPTGQTYPNQAAIVQQYQGMSPAARQALLLGGSSNQHNALIAAGEASPDDVNQASYQWGGYAGVDRASGRPWVSYDGQTRTYL